MKEGILMSKGKYNKNRKAEQAELKRQKQASGKNKFKALMKKYFIDAMGAMALGLFASLLISTILGTLASYIPWEPAADVLNTIATYAKAATGMAIGVAIAHKLGAHPLVLYACAAVGAMSNAMGAVINGGAISAWAVTAKASDMEGIFYFYPR